MYLKSIEIQGFKSFAHKFTFEFHNGITAIVGPNGSGKSNVADAVRWVLGEQSAKQLRGDKMEDVIFSGTETRKPLSYAYVAITFHNSDHKLPTPYEEVTVARRVYRSGESEYLMNGARCYLKDIKDIFLDTGIGKEGYSIIGQGQIERILSGKPEERRELFDEAAGIVKHKKRKKATEKDLEVGRQNLQRVEDVLTEMEKQIGPLKSQSEKAKEYLQLKEKLKILDIQSFLYEYEKIKEDKEKSLENKKLAESNLEGTRKEQEEAVREFERLERDITVREESLEKKRSLSSEGKVEVEKLEGDVKVLKAEIASAHQNKEHYEERLTSIKKSVENAKEEWDRYETDRRRTKDKLTKVGVQKEQYDGMLEALKEKIVKYKEEVSERNSDTIELLNESSRIKAKQQQIKTMLEQNALKKVELDAKLLKNKHEEELAEEEIRQDETALREVEGQIKLKRKKREELDKEIRKLEEEWESLNIQFQEMRKRYHIEKTKLDSIKNIMERYEGYGQSVKRIMERKADYKGVIGVVADILNVRKRYETAVEIALGGSVQNIVTDTEETAKACIRYLKENRYGRATFLPLTNMRGRRTSQSEVLGEPGVIGILSELVEYEKRYKDLVEYLLGRFILVKDMDDALHLARKYRHTLRIVTLEGELINPGGSISGGTYRNASNLIGRRREMEEIKENLDKIQSARREKEEAIGRKKEEMAEKTGEVSLCNKRIKNLQLEENTLRVKYEQAVKEKTVIDEEKGYVLRDGAEIENQRKSLEESMKGVETKLLENKKKQTDNEEAIGERNELLAKMKEEERDYKEKALALNMEYSTLQQSLQFLGDNLNRVKQDWEASQKEWDGLRKGKEEAEKQMEQKKKSIEDIKDTIRLGRDRIREWETQIEEELKDREALAAMQKMHLKKKDELSKTVFELDKEVTRLVNLEERWNEQLDAKMNYMWEEYELTYHMAKEYAGGVQEDKAITLIRKETEEVKEKVRALGDVNVNAIEDYKGLSERYETLKEQHDDLVEADKKLVGVIGELDEKMRKRFTEKMKEINEQFNLVFRELFGGGKGSIEVAEDEDVLNAEIRIVPQLPGKRLQNMKQLSGGEKALTAISVLFAIQNLKPSPFCLLDEIEAALDDSNIKRFARYLHKLKKNTQFIVITHRQGTMEAADALYGITMQEKGISTMVSVKLIEDEMKSEANGGRT